MLKIDPNCVVLYRKTPFLVPGIKSNVKKKVSVLVPLLYMYLIDTKFKNNFFQSWLNPWDFKRGIKVFICRKVVIDRILTNLIFKNHFLTLKHF